MVDAQDMKQKLETYLETADPFRHQTAVELWHDPCGSMDGSTGNSTHCHRGNPTPRFLTGNSR